MVFRQGTLNGGSMIDNQSLNAGFSTIETGNMHLSSYRSVAFEMHCFSDTLQFSQEILQHWKEFAELEFQEKVVSVAYIYHWILIASTLSIYLELPIILPNFFECTFS
jgi:hypothetical protein